MPGQAKAAWKHAAFLYLAAVRLCLGLNERSKQKFNSLRSKAVREGRSWRPWSCGSIGVRAFSAAGSQNATFMITGIIHRGPTLFLRLVIVLIAVAALAICIFPLPRMIAKEAAKTPDTAWQIYLFMAGAYVQTAFFLVALYQAFRLLNLVDAHRTFSEASVRALGHIKRSAISIGALMATGVLWVMFLSAGSGDDSAGPVMIGFVGTFVSSVVAAAIAVVQTQVRKAIDTIKGSAS